MAAPIIETEVRWRRAGSEQEWRVRRFPPSDIIEIDELDRGTSYEGEARNLGPGGLASAWVPVDFVVADASNTPLTPLNLTSLSVADGVALKWSVPVDQKPDIDYSVEKAPTSSGPWTEETRVRSLQWTDPVIDQVVNWYRVRAISFAGVPSDYSNLVDEKGRTLAGSGQSVNLLWSEYNTFVPGGDVPPVVDVNNAFNVYISDAFGSAISGSYLTIECLDANTTAGVRLGESTSDFNLYLPSGKYLVSAYVRSEVIDAQFRVGLQYANLDTIISGEASIPNLPIDSTPGQRRSLVLDVPESVDVDPHCQFFLLPNHDGQGWRRWFDGIMIERVVGSVTEPSAFTMGSTFRSVEEARAATAGAVSDAAEAKAAADAANVAIGLISSDSWLSKSEKPRVMSQHQILMGEVPEVRASADRYGVSRVAHDDALFALNVYLGSLSPNWNDTTQDTPIVGSTFRSKFADYFATRQALLTTIAAMAKAGLETLETGFANEIVDNATFSLPLDPAGNVPGWKPFLGADLGYLVSGAYNGANVLDIQGSAVSAGAETTRRYACQPGDYISAWADMYKSTGVQMAKFQIRFYEADGSAFTEANGNHFDQNTTSATWQTLNPKGLAPANAAYFSLLAYNPSSNARTLMTNVRVSINDARVPGSGVRLGDSRNQAMVTIGNFGAAWDSLSVTYSSTTTSATITISAATLRSGGVSIAYNQSQITVSGAAGTTVKYWLYYDDPTFSGGSKALNASTNYINSISSNGRLFIASLTVTYPSSGSGGGGGTYNPCVAVDAWVVRRRADAVQTVRAHEVAVGDELRVVDPVTGHERWGRVSMSRAAPAERVRVRTASGTELTCSTSAPLGSLYGQVLAPDAVGRDLAERRAGKFAHSRCIRVEPVGEGLVQHITCENDFFLAGDRPDCLLAHHNIKPPIEP